MLRLSLGFVLFWLVVAAQAAEFDEDFFVSELNLLTTRLVHSSADFLPLYQLSASVVLTSPSDTAPFGLGFGNVSHVPSVAKPQQETIMAENTRWQQIYDGGRVSLQHLLRVEFKGEQANITLRPRSVSIEGERFRITFRPQSALIEKERLKILFQPHSVSMLWSKAF